MQVVTDILIRTRRDQSAENELAFACSGGSRGLSKNPFWREPREVCIAFPVGHVNLHVTFCQANFPLFDTLKFETHESRCKFLCSFYLLAVTCRTVLL